MRHPVRKAETHVIAETLPQKLHLLLLPDPLRDGRLFLVAHGVLEGGQRVVVAQAVAVAQVLNEKQDDGGETAG